MNTVIDFPHRDNFDRHRRWERFERAAPFEHYLELQAQGVSQRQAAKQLRVPRSTLQAWHTWQDTLDSCPHVAEFFQSGPGLAFLHRLVLALHLVCVEVGACGIRLVCLLLKLTGLDRFVGASYGTQQQVNRQVEEAIVAYRQAETARLAKDMPQQGITVTQDETFTGGLCLVGSEPVSNFIILEQLAQGRDQATLYLLQTVPGIGKVLSLVLLYEIHHIDRFPSVQEFASYCRLVKGSKESGGKRLGTSGKKIGNAHLNWAFSEAPTLFLHNNPQGQKLLSRLEKTHDQGKALSILAHKLGRAVYFMLKRKVAFDMNLFLRS